MVVGSRSNGYMDLLYWYKINMNTHQRKNKYYQNLFQQGITMSENFFWKLLVLVCVRISPLLSFFGYLSLFKRFNCWHRHLNFLKVDYILIKLQGAKIDHKSKKFIQTLGTKRIGTLLIRGFKMLLLLLQLLILPLLLLLLLLHMVWYG